MRCSPTLVLSPERGDWRVGVSHWRRARVCRPPVWNAVFWVCLSAGALIAQAVGAAPKDPLPARTRLEQTFVLTQLPVTEKPQTQAPAAGGMLRTPYGERARIVAVFPDSSPRVLSEGFHSACDPDVSFDATRILFAGKRAASDHWNIYETSVDGSGFRQITRNLGDCRSPGYQSPLYTIVSARPWYQLTFVGTGAGTMNEYGPTPATSLYSCKPDGSDVRRLTFNLSSEMDPCIMRDGRLLFAGWQRSTLARGPLGRVSLFGVNIDGTDYAAFSGDQGRRIKHMPCVTAKGLTVFVEADVLPRDGSGYLSCVKLRRPLHSYRPITGKSDGLFHTPSPVPDGTILVSRRPADGSATHGVWRVDPASGNRKPVFDDPDYHDVQARLIHPRPEPEGRSSVVSEEDPHGKLYCLNVYLSDLEDPKWMPPGVVKRVRVLEGVPLRTCDADAYLPPGEQSAELEPGSTVHGIPPLALRRVLGEIPLERDGSFQVSIPANTPVELQILDADGLALRTCSWIWAKNHEPRGCIGCHEDGELTPENRLMDAAARPAAALCPPPARRRTVDFRNDVMPIIAAKCAGCHRQGQAAPRLDGPQGSARFNPAYRALLASEASAEGFSGKYVHPGKARTSPVIWHVFGRNTSRGWDGTAAGGRVKQIPPGELPPLTENEKRTLVEWIDLGASWDGTAGADRSSTEDNNDSGVTR